MNDNTASMPIISTVGGLMSHNRSHSFYTTVNFEPGNYAIISNINGDDFPDAGLYKTLIVK